MEWTQSANFETRAIASGFNTWAMGFDRESDQGFRLGFAAGTQTGSMVSGGQFSSDFRSDNAMIYGFKTVGDWDFAGALHYGHASFDTARNVGITGQVPDGSEVSYGSGTNRHKISQLGLNLDASRKFALDQRGAYLRPNAGIDLVHFRSKGGAEDGLAEAGLRINKSSNTFVTGRVGVELGIDRQISDADWLNAYIGVSHYFRNKDDFTTSTSFIGADPRDGGFTNHADFGSADDVLSAGISIVNKKHDFFFDLGYMLGKQDGRNMNRASMSVGLKF